MKKRAFLLSVFATLVAGWVPVAAAVRTVSLNSSDGVAHWQLMPVDEVKANGAEVSTVGFQMSDPVPGIVPGVVFTAYVEAGREANPDYADNIYKVDETKYNRPYWYRTEFELPASSADERVWLCFKNTNRYADFWLNGQKISGTVDSQKDVSGHMLRSFFDVTSIVKREGTNALAVLVWDADQKKTRTDPGPYGVACSPSYLAGAGWDWMPYVPGRLAGITGDAYISFTRDAVIRDPWMRSFLPSNDKAELTFSADIVNTNSEERDFEVRGTVMPGNISFSKTVRVRGSSKATIHISKNDIKEFAIDNPRLWWPNGYGEPNLYTCSLEVVSHQGAEGQQPYVSDRASFRFGIRRYDYRIEKNAVDYPVLNIYCNGQRIFCRGGNWGMSEYLLRCHGSDYEPKIRLHREMNYNMIRLWTGCVTDEEFYDYCDEYGMMVWDDFWLYVAFNDVADHNAFKVNARDKVRRLRNHPSIAVWCGANETHPVADIDEALRMIVMEEDAGDRLYKSCSNQDALSGSGWWKDLPPSHHFSTSAGNLAFNKPAYPYGINYGYGFRSEIGMATFPSYESTCLFIPVDKRWPLPTDEELASDDENVWNRHFFGKEASNAGPADYRRSVDERYGVSKSLEEFCEKAQLINYEDMKGMYEAWNDKMWEDASGMLIWMSHPAYPSFVWQTYDYYYDPTGCYWGAKKGCEPLHIQWNCLTGSVKVINATNTPLVGARATARVYDVQGNELDGYMRTAVVNVPASNRAEAFVLPAGDKQNGEMQFIRLTLTASDDPADIISDNFYWRHTSGEMDYRILSTLPSAKVTCRIVDASTEGDETTLTLRLFNNSPTSTAFACRVRLVNSKSGERILPAYFTDNYLTLFPNDDKTVKVTIATPSLQGGFSVLLKPFGKKERVVAKG
ncbi:MAG: beta galactosidase jelly roll domain-containing protein [Bacteroidaceae bacterium]|nr:beta galactosidase jelly roll domain-containing protein [Bacteroidaceae bacterium]